VSQLAEHASEKFSAKGIPSLSYNNKLLDSSLPLRFTPLTNNSKLQLSVKQGSLANQTIATKLFANVNGEQKSFLQQIPTDLSLELTLQKFESAENVLLKRESIQLLILNQTYTDLSVSLRSIVGSASNIAIRVNYSQLNFKSHEEQKKIIELQLKQQQERNEKLKLQKQQLESERTERIKKGLANQNNTLLEPKPQESSQAHHRQNREQELDDHIVHQIDLEMQSEPPEPAPTPNETSIYTYNPAELNETLELYTPSTGSVTRYENPDDDYNMTVNQAMTYQKIIQNSAKRINKKTNRAPPTKLFIRIKFPDRNILQVNFIEDLQNTKFGHLIRKIDDLLLPDFINNYNLKVGYPPFTKLEQSFDNNSKKLIDIDYFMEEKVVLIWETTIHSTGPFLKQNAINNVKSSSELPELILEQHRGELPSDLHVVTSNEPSEYRSTKQPGNKMEKKLPKWFKTK
jgi:hypothetical protein